MVTAMGACRFDDLISRYRVVRDLRGTLALLEYDQQVSMPPKGAKARASMTRTVETLLHHHLADPRLGELLDELGSDGSLDEIQRASVRVLKRDHDRAAKLTQELVGALAECRSLAYQAWTEARPAHDFSLLEPHLERMLKLKVEEADALGWEAERYDAMLDLFEPGTTTAEVEAVFGELNAGLKPLAERILAAAPERPAFLGAPCDVTRQKEFCDWLVTTLGFDVQAGRLDLSPHPFTMFIGVGDTRQTTRTEERGLFNSIYAALHETGHALYEQGIPEELRALPVGDVPSLGIHESQSRLWENQVGRSRAFCDFMLPHLKERFDVLGMVEPDAFYAAMNHPERSLIRVHADEVTYNLHVALRFELELALFRGQLEVRDLPEAFADAMERHVGLRPSTVADGALQDMHWSIGALGYFPTYTIGTLYAAAFFARARQDLPDLDDDLRRGETAPLRAWLADKVYRHGFVCPAPELAAAITGEPLSARAFLDHLEEKYGELYDL
jgi:carboxypeptidase Taq